MRRTTKGAIQRAFKIAVYNIVHSNAHENAHHQVQQGEELEHYKSTRKCKIEKALQWNGYNVVAETAIQDASEKTAKLVPWFLFL